VTYTINGKEWTEFDINKRCAELLGLIVQTEFEKRIGFTEEFHKAYPNTVWCAEVDERGDQVSAWEQMVFTRCPENTWPIIEKCWDELNESTLRNGGRRKSHWQDTMQQHNCTKLVAACICFIEENEA
tara:strand:+ start:46 stop:429 length:384 start_codon:yes stop_codon:yes gene_type:complete